MNDLIKLSATALAQVIREKQVSASEVVDAYISRIEAINPKLNAVVQLTADQAREQAKSADDALAAGQRVGSLHGVPMTLKDSIDTAGVISTAGTSGRANYVPSQDATVAARLRRAGAILLGKTNTPELTLSYETDNLVYGRTNNPYDVGRSPGGSSGGAASIVAAGGSAFDLGTDTGGSIRQPAHFCGVAGLKPTSGRVPRTGHIVSYDMGALESLTQIGPIARSVDDLNLILSVIAGPDADDPYIVPISLRNPDQVRLASLRVATYTDNEAVTPTADVINTVQAALSVLADAGATISEAGPQAVTNTHSLWMDLATADGGAWIKQVLDQAGTTQIHPIIETRFLNRPTLSTAEYNTMLRYTDQVRSDMHHFMQDYDLIVCPVNAYPTMPHSEAAEKVTGYTYTRIYNITGWPVVVVRAGTSAEGMPIGVQLVAQPWREDVALAAAKQIEQVLGGWQMPNL